MCSNGWKLFLERRIQTSLETDTPGADETSTLQSICDNGKIAKSEATWKVYLCLSLPLYALTCFNMFWYQVQCFHLGRELDIESLDRILAGRTSIQVRQWGRGKVRSFCENRRVFATAGPRRFCMDLDGSERQHLAGDTGRWDFPHLFCKTKD